MTEERRPIERGAAQFVQQMPRIGRIAVYSCHFGRHEPLNPDCMAAAGQCDRFLFTDARGIDLPDTQVIRLRSPGIDAARFSRLPKLRPHLFFAPYDWTIYIDNNADLRIPAAEIVARVEETYGGAAPAGRFLFPHLERNCAYREASVCQGKGYLTRDDFSRITSLFSISGFPKRAGLFANTCLVQKMGSPETDRFNDLWYATVVSLVRRDQILLPFLIWQGGLRYGTMPLAMPDVLKWPHFPPRVRARTQAAANAGEAADTTGPPRRKRRRMPEQTVQ